MKREQHFLNLGRNLQLISDPDHDFSVNVTWMSRGLREATKRSAPGCTLV